MQEYLAGGEVQWCSPPPGRSRVGVQEGVEGQLRGWEWWEIGRHVSSSGAGAFWLIKGHGVILSAFSSGTDVV